MSIFNYTLPSGSEFVVRGPAGATQVQADRIFYEQVAAGSFVGYESGQTLTSTATQITKFELSRLDRGTAGVDNTPVLAIIQGLPVIAGIPNLANVPLTSPVDEADIVVVKGDDLGPDTVGPLTSYQVQKLLAQITNLVAQESDQISLNKGIGRYGFTAYALEQAGYVKPGTSLKFFAGSSDDFVAVMSSPSVWTGKDGVYSLADLLNDPQIQTKIQTEIMQQGYDELLANGTITKPPQSSVKLSTGQVFTNLGLQSASALTALSLLGNNLGGLNNLARNAVTSSAALNRLLSSANVNLNTIGSGAINSLTAGLGNLGNLSSVNFAALSQGLSNRITGSVGALVANASKFGSQATALWAKSGGLSFDSIGSSLTAGIGSNFNNITGQFSSLANGLTGSVNGLTSNLTNLVPGSLSNLTANLDIFGKAGSFATNFANPLGSLSNLGNLSNLGSLGNLGAIQGQLTGQLGQLSGALTGQLGALSGQLTGQLGQLSGALTGQLGALSGQLTGALGSLGSFANIGSIGNLFGGGGDLVSGTQVAAGFNNTVNRATVDAAFARIVGNDKVPLPTYQYPSLASLAPRLDIQLAQNFLKNLQSSGGTTFGQTVTI
jgi:hypothetical protein